MKILIPIVLAMSTLSCSARQSPQTNETANATSSVYDTIPFKVYMTFSEFEPHLQHSNDTTYVFNFWATWCKPCLAEMPYFEKLIQAYKDKPVKVWLVSMDFPKDIEKKLVPFVMERRLEQNVLSLADMDYNAWIDKVSTDWDGAIPFSLIYNRNKRSVKTGELEGFSELEAMLKKVMPAAD